MRLLERMVEKPHACAYLPAESASLEVRVMLDVTADEMDALLERGWRRFGPDLFPAGMRLVRRMREPARRGRPIRAEQEPAPRGARLRPPPARGRAAPRRRRAPRALREVARGPRGRARMAAQRADPRSATRSSSRSPIRARAKRPSTTTRAADGSSAWASSTPRHERCRPRSSSTIPRTLGCRSGRRTSFRSSTTPAHPRAPHVYLGYRVEGCASLRYKAAFRAARAAPRTARVA